MSKVTRNSKVFTMNKLLSKFHLQQYLPLFQKHNIDFKTFLTLNEQALQSIGIINETHRNILVCCIQKFSELLTTKAATVVINDPMILITNDDETNHLINAGDLTEDYYESEDQSEDQSEDFDDGATIATIATIEAVTKVIKDEDYDIENDDVDVVEQQHENDHLTVTIVEGSDHERNVVQTEAESDVIYQSPDTCEIPEDFPPPYSSPTQEPITSTIPSSPPLIIRDSLIKRSISFLRPRRQKNDNILINKIARDHKSHKLPSYYEAIENDSSEEGKEELPIYSCSVGKVGYLMKKNEMVAEEQKANDRSWRKIYVHLRGTFLRIYKNEHGKNNNSPISQFSMCGAKVSLALDYTKKRNVLRIRLLNGRSYLFQAPDRCEFISWIEKLQSSANISSTIDEREMPMFITLPTRRRRGTRTCNDNNNSNINSRYLMQMTTSGLTYQHFNDLARELQVVQVVDVLPQQQLLW